MSSLSKPKVKTPVTILDGGLGTTLVDDYGCVFDDSTPLWSSHLLLTSPTTLLAAQSSFISAGATLLLTATYQASLTGFALTSPSIPPPRASSLMRSAVTLLSTARTSLKTPDVKIVLSLGAYGATMIPSTEYSGMYDGYHVTEEQLGEWHWERLGVFMPSASPNLEDSIEEEEREEVWDNVDMIAFETLPLLAEIWAARSTMHRAATISQSPKKPFWISCVFPGDGNVLPDGSSVAAAVTAMLSPSTTHATPYGIGINCTRLPKLSSLILEFEDAVSSLIQNSTSVGVEVEWPVLVVYPDGTMGEVYNTVTKKWEKKDVEEAEEMGSWDEVLWRVVERTRERGCWRGIFVGGCCKTGAKEIGRLSERLRGSE